jgi:hypothetical protein
MDFRTGDNMPPAQQVHQPRPAQPVPAHRKHIDWAARTIRFELFTVIVGSALLLAAVSLYIAFGGSVKTESSRVDASKYQAVFLNGGVTSGSVSYSTYFGHITKLTSSYVVLNNVYYLTDQSTSTSSSAASSPQLVKLGCQQLHSPYDEMVINRSQVAFWENLQTSGKVVQAIQSYIKQNPNGPNCSQTTSGSSSSTSSTTPQSTTTTPATTPTTGH